MSSINPSLRLVDEFLSVGPSIGTLKGAIKTGNLPCLKKYLEYGFDPNMKVLYKKDIEWTLFELAIANTSLDTQTHLTVINIFLDHFSKHNLRERTNFEGPLCIAIQRKHQEIIERLVGHGVRVEDLS